MRLDESTICWATAVKYFGRLFVSYRVVVRDGDMDNNQISHVVSCKPRCEPPDNGHVEGGGRSLVGRGWAPKQ